VTAALGLLLHGTNTVGLSAATELSRTNVVAIAAAVRRLHEWERSQVSSPIQVDAIADQCAVLDGPNDAGPIADLLRLNTGIAPTPVGQQKRLGFIAGDSAGFPNGRRPVDDVVRLPAAGSARRKRTAHRWRGHSC
jgi:hypothetical protein